MISFFTCNTHKRYINAGTSFYISVAVEIKGFLSNLFSFLWFSDLKEVEKHGDRGSFDCPAFAVAGRQKKDSLYTASNEVAL